MTICDFDDFIIVETLKGHGGKGGRSALVFSHKMFTLPPETLLLVSQQQPERERCCLCYRTHRELSPPQFPVAFQRLPDRRLLLCFTLTALIILISHHNRQLLSA